MISIVIPHMGVKEKSYLKIKGQQRAIIDVQQGYYDAFAANGNTPIPDMKKMLLSLVHQIWEKTFNPYETIVVHHNTDSPDEDISASVDKYIFDEKRLSCAEAYNKGFSHARGDVFIQMHDDVELPDKWDDQIVLAAKEGFIGCVFEDDTDSDCDLRGVEKSNNKYIPSCVFALSRSTWDLLAGYDEQFEKFHWEDTDLFIRGAIAGHGPVRCDTTVKHRRGVTRSFLFDDQAEAGPANSDRYVKKHQDLFDRVNNGRPFWLYLPERANYPPQEEK